MFGERFETKVSELYSGVVLESEAVLRLFLLGFYFGIASTSEG
jgi:hypothetical protein